MFSLPKPVLNGIPSSYHYADQVCHFKRKYVKLIRKITHNIHAEHSQDDRKSLNIHFAYIYAFIK